MKAMNLLKSIFTYFATGMLLLSSSGAWAQSAKQNFPQINVMTPTGIDLQTAEFVRSGVDLQIGPLVADHYLRDTIVAPSLGLTPAPYLTSLNNRVRTETAGGGVTVTILLGATRVRFTVVGTNVFAMDSSAPGWKFSYSGSTSTLRYKNGDVYNFQPYSGSSSWQSGLLASKQAADGTRTEYFYDASNKVNFVRSNKGYAISINYMANKAVACGINLAETYAVQGFSCTGSPLAVEYTFNSNGYVTAIKDIRGNTRTINYNAASGTISCITFPASATCEVQNVVGTTIQGEYYQSQQTTADGRVYNIGYSSGTESPSDYVPFFGEIRYSSSASTDVDGRGIQARFGNGFLVSSRDAEGNNVSYEYLLVNAFAIGFASGWSGPHYSTAFPWKVTYAEGNSTEFIRDNADNVIYRKDNPKPASAVAATSTTWIYPPTNVWSNPTICNAADVLCDKVTKFTDTSGAETDYAYDATHGGILSKTAPAGPNGVRPQIRYSYTQRNAMIKNAAGAFIAMQPPVWVLTQESGCKAGTSTATGCAVNGDEVRTTSDYGPTTGANNLLLRGVVNDATGIAARICYQYDTQGRKIAETAPLGTGSTCP